MPDLSTPRLWLRQWRASDREPFAALNADPRVMEFMPACLSRAESDAVARGSEAEIAQLGFGFCVEIGWRLERASWGQGFATEAGRECLRFAFESLVLEAVVSFTVPANRRSRAVMERLGMRRAAGWAPATSPRALSPAARGLAGRRPRDQTPVRPRRRVTWTVCARRTDCDDPRGRISTC